MNITELEKQIIINIAENLYTPLNGCEPDETRDATCWTDCVGSDGPYQLEGKVLSGGFSSLTKKGLIWSESGREGITGLTDFGLKVYKEIKGGTK